MAGLHIANKHRLLNLTTVDFGAIHTYIHFVLIHNNGFCIMKIALQWSNIKEYFMK